METPEKIASMQEQKIRSEVSQLTKDIRRLRLMKTLKVGKKYLIKIPMQSKKIVEVIAIELCKDAAFSWNVCNVHFITEKEFGCLVFQEFVECIIEEID